MRRIADRISVLPFVLAILPGCIHHTSLSTDPTHCADAADAALVQLGSWEALRQWFEQYPQYDDGYFAEGISQFVVHTLATRWETLDNLQDEFAINRSFRKFVLSHIDSTTDWEDLRAVVEHSKVRCPRRLKTLCTELAIEAQRALEESRQGMR